MAGRNRRLFAFGVVAVAVGVVGGLVLWFAAGKRYDDAVADLAPAPIGCDTTLSFDKTGTFTFFVETKGSVGEIDGDCDADDRSYDVGDADPPRVTLTLRDDRGDEIDLDRIDGPEYDGSGARGRGYQTVTIDDTGDYVLTAEAADDSVMIRIGRDPSSGVAPMRIGAILVLLTGVTAGVTSIALSRRRPSGPAPSSYGSVTPWPSIGVHAPPTAPPYANPPVAPPYAQPHRPPTQPGPAPVAPRPPGLGPDTRPDRPLPPPPPPPPPRSG